MSATGPIDLTQLPAPDIIDALSFEAVFNEMRASLVALDPSLIDVLQLESEPLVKLLQVSAMRELLLRQRINNAAQGVMIAYAKGADLDHLVALLKVRRLVITPADANAIPPTAAVYESDESLRARAQLALDGLSTAGPERAYIFHALSADGQVLDASADAPRFDMPAISSEVRALLPDNALVLVPTYSAGLSAPMPGDVVVTILARDGDGTPTPALIDTVQARIGRDDIRPMTDNAHTRGASIINYSIDATLFTLPGPDSELVLQEARQKTASFVEESRRLGKRVALSGIYAALHGAGVQRVELTSPSADIVCSLAEAAHCQSISIHFGGVGA